jgi:Methyltransferase domain
MENAKIDCRICGEHAAAYADVIVRGRHSSRLFRCGDCGFVFLCPVYWLDEAYSAAETPLDVGSISRNLHAAEFLSKRLGEVTRRSDLFVDFGGGYGLLVRLMRDKGYHFHLHDPLATNLFASYCAADRTAFERYRALTAIEVFEHLTDPLKTVEEMLEWSRCIIFTTELCPEERPAPDHWWYFALEEGQHVSFYTRKSLEAIASRFALRYFSLGASWHVLALPGDPIAAQNDGARLARGFIRQQVARVARRARRSLKRPLKADDRESLTWRDYTQARSIVLDGLTGRRPIRHLDERMKPGW